MTGTVPTEEEWLALFESLSNWGRWGDDDQLGLLNLLTPEKVARAAALVRSGRHVSCSRLVEFAERAAGPETSIPPLHFMSWSGSAAPEHGGSGAIDWLGLPLHGLYVTHLDAPSHAFWNGRMFNGIPAATVTAEGGARNGSIELAERGIVTRGVLLDVARLLGRDVLEPGHAVDADELERAAVAAGVAVEPGDLVMVRTGYGSIRRARPMLLADGEDESGAPHLPGLGVASLPWFAAHDVAVVGTDTATEARPTPYSFNAPVHAVLMCAMGAWVIDNLDLEELARTCDGLGRWEFFVTVAPLRLRRATGSPVNPIAVF
jgi:kynurenine formamidase